MVFKGQTADEHPGHELSQIAHQEEARDFIPPEKGGIAQNKEAQEAAPAEGGVQKGADRRAAAVIKVFQIVENGADIQDPLVPAGGIGVFGDDVGVIMEHKSLIVQNNPQGFPAEKGRALGTGVGKIGEIIDKAGDEHEKQQAEKSVFQERPQGRFPAAPSSGDG